MLNTHIEPKDSKFGYPEKPHGREVLGYFQPYKKHR